ncbi:CMRF35-like molecule 1 [Sardina pilchardus]|uniref:CMRF35-like molecule 1 n=1 Tax=Sardina pilchardus TaxID=27697 RepID=UPI002E0FF8BD
MKMMIVYLCLISGVNVVTAVIQVTGYIGESAVIRCPYDKEYVGYSKYLCRGSCPRIGGKDIPIRTEAGQTKAMTGIFYLHDDPTAGVFTVTITGLTAEDSGQYWCGVKTGFGKSDVYTELKLDVLPARVVPKTTKVVSIPEVTVSITTPEVTDVSSTTTLMTTDYFACEDCKMNTVIKSQQPAVGFNVVVGSGVAGLAVLLIIAVVLGCRVAKRNKSLETPDDTPLSQSAPTTANIYTDTETTREGNTSREIDSVYECLELKECGSDAEYEGLGALSSGKSPLPRVIGYPGKGKEKDTLGKAKKGSENAYGYLRDTQSISKGKKGGENEYESMRNTLSISKAKKGAENEYESMRDTLSISKASKGAENEYESMRDTLSISKASRGAENEYESMRDTLSISKANKGAENEYESMGGMHSIASKGAKNDHNPEKAALSKARKGVENEYMSMKATLPRAVQSNDTVQEFMRDTLNRVRK